MIYILQKVLNQFATKIINTRKKRILERAKDQNGSDSKSYLVKHAIKKNQENVNAVHFKITSNGFRGNSKKTKLSKKC